MSEVHQESCYDDVEITTGGLDVRPTSSDSQRAGTHGYHARLHHFHGFVY